MSENVVITNSNLSCMDNRTVLKVLEGILTEAVKKGASDIHLKTSSYPIFRINGKIIR